MLRIKPLCLAPALFSTTSLACSGVPSAAFYYQPWGQGTKYSVEDSDDYGLYFPDIHLPQVKFKQLRRVPNGTDDKYDSPDNINNDFVQVDADTYIRTNGGWRFDWLTDGRHILWAGKIVQNPPGTPKVDAATFRAWGRFAADKDSLYFDGERTDDNRGEKQVDMDSLQQVGGRVRSGDSADVLKDRRNIYFQGRWLGSAQGYSILGVKSWTRRPILYSPNSCESKSNPGTVGYHLANPIAGLCEWRCHQCRSGYLSSCALDGRFTTDLSRQKRGETLFVRERLPEYV